MAGTVRGHNSRLGGISYYLRGDDGHVYFSTTERLLPEEDRPCILFEFGLDAAGEPRRGPGAHGRLVPAARLRARLGGPALGHLTRARRSGQASRGGAPAAGTATTVSNRVSRRQANSLVVGSGAALADVSSSPLLTGLSTLPPSSTIGSTLRR